MSKKLIQIKCVTKCKDCSKEEFILDAFTYTKEDFPNLSYKEFFNIAENDYKRFEEIIKENLTAICECGSEANIIEILDIQYIN